MYVTMTFIFFTHEPIPHGRLMHDPLCLQLVSIMEMQVHYKSVFDFDTKPHP